MTAMPDGDTNDLVTWLSGVLDEDEAWAVAASQARGAGPETGERWTWVDANTDEPISPDPAVDDYLGTEAPASLRSVEHYPTTSVGPLPSFLLTSDEVFTAAAGHIIRHDPATVLADIAAKRRILAVHKHEHPFPRDPDIVGCVICDRGEDGCVCTSGWCDTIRLIASAYADRPEYRQEWAP